jgi:outer membrane protein OmpA-like peptidoglycan-associated protein
MKLGARTLCVILAASVAAWSSINTAGQRGLVRTLSGETNGKLRLRLGFGTNYAQDHNYVSGPQPSFGSVLSQNSRPVNSGAARLLSSNAYIAFGPTSFLDIAMSLPFYYDWAGFGDVRDGGIGDLEASVKLLYPPPDHNRVVYASYYLAVSAPTGMRENGIFPRNVYYYDNTSGSQPASVFYSSDLPNIKPMLLWTFNFGNAYPSVPLVVHLNLGGVFSTNLDRSNTAVGRLAVEYVPVDPVSIFVDLSGESRARYFNSDFDVLRDPLMVSPGIQLRTPAGVDLTLAGDICVSSQRNQDRVTWAPGNHNYEYSTSAWPQWGVQFRFAWSGFVTTQDDDGDGIPNDADRCPKDAEDMDGFEDVDGCPDDDNDKDGVPDAKDKCPEKPEDQDGVNDEDGCPDNDNDGDGIADLKDDCPRMPEDFDGIEDRDGCPDEDNDKDGILDSLDRCPNDPEDVDKFEDEDGCPDIDNDKDGIPDLKDKCPNKPETFNGVEDEDGCPDKKQVKKKEPPMPKHQVLKGVTFKSGSVEMSFESYPHLEPIVRIMKEYPEVEIEIRGHTDSIGKYENNMRLSQMRAESVRQYLLSKGIEPGRMRAVGFGPSSPIADNRTATGRAQTRRIEIVRIK